MHRPTGSEHTDDHGLALEALAFAEITRAIQAERPLEETLQLVAARARDTMRGDTEVSISSAGTVVATGTRAHILDEWQSHAGNGPSADAAASGHTITVDLDDPGNPYTSFSVFATGLDDLRSVTSAALPMLIARHAGALTVYRFGSQPLPRPMIRLIEKFAAYTAVAIAAAEDGLLYDAATMADHAQAAAGSAAVFERAKGITMARYACSADIAEIYITIAAQQADLPPAAYAHALTERFLHD